MEWIGIADSIRDVWIGDVLELHESTTGFKMQCIWDVRYMPKPMFKRNFTEFLT
jgi:hypothetical protein